MLSPRSGTATSAKPAAASATAIRLCLRRLAVDQPHLLRRTGQRPQAAQQVAVVGVTRQAGQLYHLRLDRQRLSQYANLFSLLRQPPAKRVGRLKAGQQDRAAAIFKVLLEVIKHPSGLAHATRRDNHARLPLVVQGNALVDLLHEAHLAFAEQVGILLQQPQGLVVKAFRVARNTSVARTAIGLST